MRSATPTSEVGTFVCPWAERSGDPELLCVLGLPLEAVARGFVGRELPRGGPGRAREERFLDADVVAEPLEVAQVRYREGRRDMRMRRAVGAELQPVGGGDSGGT